MIELRPRRGPLSDEELDWVAQTYGLVDERYASEAYLRHQLGANPAGPSLHVFLLADGVPGGHCCVVPLPLRMGERQLRGGKFEALVLAPEHRGGTLAADMVRELIGLADAEGLDVLFAYVRPSVVRVFSNGGCGVASPDAVTRVAFVRPRLAAASWSTPRRVLARALGALQLGTLAVLGAVLRVRCALEEPVAADAGLVAPPLRADAWTVAGDEAWEWLRGSERIQALELPGRSGGRALLRRGEASGTAVELLAWQPRRDTVGARLRLLVALVRVARAQGAATLRIQPWGGGVESVARTARLLGFAGRSSGKLPVHARAATLESAVAVNPFFHATF
jgi:hypothetical protein